jgi:N utilization substance protein B
MKTRTKARCVALQVLYELDLTDHKPGEVYQERISDESLAADMTDFTHQIVFGVWPVRNELDEFIAEQAPDWPMEQVATIDRNIIRIALWEFAVSGITPIKVAINEAVEMAKVYGSDSTPRFVNGVLGSLASRENEIRQSLKNLSEGK